MRENETSILESVAYAAGILAVLFAISGQALGEENCSAEGQNILSALEQIKEREPGVSVMIGQVERAIEYCEEGQSQLYNAFVSPARDFIAKNQESSRAALEFPSGAELSGEWCYEHESGERGNYEFREDGTYRLAPAEMNWQWVQEGAIERAFRDMELLESSKDALLVEIRGAYTATFTRGFCEGSQG